MRCHAMRPGLVSIRRRAVPETPKLAATRQKWCSVNTILARSAKRRVGQFIEQCFGAIKCQLYNALFLGGLG